MRSLGGFVLLAGIGFGLFVYLPAPVDSRLSLAQVHEALASQAELKTVAIRTAAARSGSHPKDRSAKVALVLAAAFRSRPWRTKRLR